MKAPSQILKESTSNIAIEWKYPFIKYIVIKLIKLNKNTKAGLHGRSAWELKTQKHGKHWKTIEETF